ncbi:MAG: hypothetical protein M1821_009638 [Bathelium mastoideum]|nr:MAG: hypothetical protein M1821_009638 [Bathelium mastoideum]
MSKSVLQGLSQESGSQSEVQSSAVEIFINDTSVAPYSSPAYDHFVDLSVVSAADFSIRLGIVLNTYFQILSSPLAFLGDLPQNLSLYGSDTTPIEAISTWFGSNATLDNVLDALENLDVSEMPISSDLIAVLSQAPFVADTANATVVHGIEVYVCNRTWLVFLLVATTFLLLLGITAAVLNFIVIAPDMLGYVSSMTYDNSGLRDIQQGLPAEAMKRTRILRNLEVKIGDARADGDVGHLTITTAKECGTLSQQERKYTS